MNRFDAGAAQHVIQPDASIAWLSSLFGFFILNALCSARINSSVKLLIDEMDCSINFRLLRGAMLPILLALLHACTASSPHIPQPQPTPLVAEGMPILRPSEAISVQNAGRIRYLARKDKLMGLVGAVWSKDGRWLAAGIQKEFNGGAAEIKVCDATTLEPVRTIIRETGEVYDDWTFLDDGNRLAAASRRADSESKSIKVQLWRSDSGELLQTHVFKYAKDSYLNDAAISSDGKTLAVALYQGAKEKIEVWSLPDERLLYTIEEDRNHTSTYLCRKYVAFAPGDKLLLTGGGYIFRRVTDGAVVSEIKPVVRMGCTTVSSDAATFARGAFYNVGLQERRQRDPEGFWTEVVELWSVKDGKLLSRSEKAERDSKRRGENNVISSADLSLAFAPDATIIVVRGSKLY
jgi:WD40 repeat protein